MDAALSARLLHVLRQPVFMTVRRRAFFGSLSRVGVNLFLRHRNDIPVSLYVKDRKIRFLKFSKFRYPKAFRLITLKALFVPSVKPLV